jgi:tetratricopeptide (TPR) repeat protein
MYDWDWAEAERSIQRALELDSNSHHWIAALFRLTAGSHDEAIAHFHTAEARNPLSDALKTQLANAYACAGRYDEAEAQARESHARVKATGRMGVVGDTLRTAARRAANAGTARTGGVPALNRASVAGAGDCNRREPRGRTKVARSKVLALTRPPTPSLSVAA